MEEGWAEGTTNQIARRFAENERQLKDLLAQAEVLSQHKKAMEDVLLERFAEEGVSKVTVDGATVHLRSQLWAGREEEVTADEAYEALVATDLKDFGTRGFNHNSLSAVFREFDKKAAEANRNKYPHPDGEGVQWTLWDFAPATLKGIIKTSTTYNVRVRINDQKGT